MNTKNFLTALATEILSLAVFTPLNAEVFTETYTTTECKDYEFITEMLIGPGVARHPSGALINQSKSYQVGVFSNLVAKAIPTFTNGVILSTGKIGQGPSTQNEKVNKQWSGESIWPNGVPEEYGVNGDIDLYNYFGKKLNDQAGIVLYVQPRNRTINIPFFMASEYFYYQTDLPVMADTPSYESYTNRSDKFVFFLKEIADASDPNAFDSSGNVIDDGSPMTPYRNIAQLPTGGDVEISTVNQHTNTQYFLSNVGPTNEYGELEFPFADIKLPMEFNGAIVGPVAVAEGLDTNKVYKLKIIVADDFNNIVNSAIFLRARGITSGADLAVDVTGPAKLDVAGTVTFTNTVSNIEAATADGVKVTQWLPTGIDETKLDTIKASVKCSTGSVTSWGKQGETNFFVWTIGERFASGSNAVLTIDCPLPNSGCYQCIAKVETSTGDYNESNNVDDFVTTVGDPTSLPVLTITAIDTNKTYGAAWSVGDQRAFILKLEGTNGTEQVASVDLAFTNSVGEVIDPQTATVGTYGVVLSNIKGEGISSLTFSDIVYKPGKLTIEKAALTITAANTNKIYGTEQTFTGKMPEFAVEGLAGEDKVDSVTLASDGSAADAAFKADGYPIVPSGATGTGLENYEISYAAGTLSVAKRQITVRAKDATKTYGDVKAFVGTEFEISSGSLAAGDTLTTVTLTSDGAAEDAACTTDGYAIKASNALGKGLANYEITYVDGKLSVEKRPLEITARNRSKTYGQSVAFAGVEFNITDGELRSGDKVMSITLTCDGAKTTAAYKADGYPIKASAAQGTGLGNYTITYVDGTLIIKQAPLTVTAKDATKVYGDPLVFVGTEFDITAGQLLNDDTLTAVTLTSEGAAAGALYKVEGYPIVASAVQGSGLENYAITYVNGLLALTKRAITIRANDATKTYGETKAFVGTEFVISVGNLVNGDTVSAVTLTSEGAAANALYKAEGYPIVASAARGSGLDGYAIAYADGLLSIAKRAITIKANDTTKTYGEAVVFSGSEFTISEGSLANGDSVDSVVLASDGAVATAVYKPGGYPITASSAEGTGLDNYTLTYADGTLTIEKRTITIKADDATKAYGETKAFAGTEFTISAGSLADGDAVTSVTLVSDGEMATAAYKAAGYPIKASAAQGTGLDSYTIDYADGKLMVSKCPLTISAKDGAKQYGETLTFSGTEFEAVGLQNGELITTVALSSEKASNVKTEVNEYKEEIEPFHPIGGINTNNYDIAFSNGTLTVTQAVLTISVNDATWKIKKSKPQYSFTDFSLQLKAGDTIADITGGTGIATDLVYSNKVWETKTPAKGDENLYEDEIWVNTNSIAGMRAKNYIVAIDPGDLTVVHAEAELKTTISTVLNWNTGLLDFTMTVKNVGDGEVEPDYDYWVELKPGPATTGTKSGKTVNYPKSYYIASPTGTMPDGYDYVDLTSKVKTALRQTGNRDEIFDPGEQVSVSGVSVYHWKRWKPELFIDANAFFVTGYLFNSADADQDFKISEQEKMDAGGILGTSSADYLEVTRLELLQYYHWKSSEQTWVGPTR